MHSRALSSTTPNPRIHLRRRLLDGLVGALLLVSVSAPALAAEVNWFGPTGGNWSVISNWFPFQLPAAGDVVWVKAQTGTPISVVYSSATGPVFSKVHIDSVGNGPATLVQTGDHLAAAEENVGVFKLGVHSMSGGTSTVTKLHLGFWGGAGGVYNLSGTGALLAGMESIGNTGWGVFNHSAGSNTVTGDLNLGLFGSGNGTYNLSGTAAVSSNNLFVGNAGVGRFNQDGASNPIANNLVIGNWGSGWGRYELSGGGSLSAFHQIIGGGGTGRLVQTDGSSYAAGNLVLGNLGGSSGTYEISGPSTLSAGIHYIGGAGYGRLEQSDGVATARGNLVMGNLGSGNGTLVLSGGEYSAQIEYIGGFGVGVVQHSGGTNTASGRVEAGTWGGAYGRYELSGTGVLEAPAMVLGGFGSGNVVQTGGEAIIAGTITLCWWPNSVGTYTLDGGLLSANHIENKAGGVVTFDAGVLDVATFVNRAQFHLGGTGLRTVSSVVTNLGSVYVAETTALFTETLANSGAYHSDDADSVFMDIDNGELGYLTGTEGSRFVVIGDFYSQSTKSTSWNTTLAELIFTDSDDDTHFFTQTGTDLGATLDGYVENFAWDTLELQGGQTLALGGSGGAVYVGALELADGLPQLASITSNGANIYYDPARAENAYLGGATHPLGGSGDAIPVPEPAMLLLLAAGLPCLAVLDARKRRRA